MRFLLDTNVVSELRRGARTNPNVAAWFDDQPADSLFLSALTIGEIREGIEMLRARDRRQAALLDRWLTGLLQFFGDRVLYVDGDVADTWGRLRARYRPPVMDALIAATARVHDLTIATRNVHDFAPLEVPMLNPWDK